MRQHIVTVAEAAHAGDLETIEQVDLGPVVKWKIAFLYQNRQDPSILCVLQPVTCARRWAVRPATMSSWRLCSVS